MESEWQTLRLGDLGKVVTGKTPSKNEINAFGKDIPFVTPRDMNGCRIIESTERSLSVGGAQTVRNSIVPPNSIAVSCIGSDMGKAAIIPHESVTNQQINTIIVDDRFDYKYVYYDLSGRKEEIRGAAGGSAQPILNKSHFSDLLITIPPLPEQKAIAHILGNLDDKIELNRRMNATLEGMAQALFKSWFVDFDPVIDNALAAGNPIPDELADRAEVRRQALADGTANRAAARPFPAAFQETEELGWIPEGWNTSTIDDECKIVGGGTPSTKNPKFWDGGKFPWVTPKDFSALQDKVLLSSSRFLTEAGLNKVSSGLLPKGTVLMSSRAPVGYLAIAQIETAINQGFIGMICNKKLPPEFILQWADSRMDDIKRAASGSTFAEISKKAFRPFEIIVPNNAPLEAYTQTAAAFYSRISDGVLASQTLTKLRDTLLPKLISGELRIEQAKTMAEQQFT